MLAAYNQVIVLPDAELSTVKLVLYIRSIVFFKIFFFRSDKYFMLVVRVKSTMVIS